MAIGESRMPQHGVEPQRKIDGFASLAVLVGLPRCFERGYTCHFSIGDALYEGTMDALPFRLECSAESVLTS